MCYTDDARPPLPPVGGAAADHRDLTLTSADGTRFMAYVARAETPNGSGMVICPDVRGLFPFYKELAVRFAEAGFEAIAFDYFGRTATDSDRGEGFDWQAQVQQTKPETVADDIRACVGYLRTAEGGNPRAVFTVGFCFGGTASWSQIGRGHGLAGAIGFYGGRPGLILPLLPQMKGEILMLLAGKDHTPPEEHAKVAEELRAGGIPVESHVYPDAPHSFFDRTYTEHAAACDDAWHRMLAFCKRLTPS